MTKIQAGLLADIMPKDAAQVLLAFGKRNMDGISVEVIDYLKSARLIKQTKDLLSGKEIWVVTPDGEKVRKALYA